MNRKKIISILLAAAMVSVAALSSGCAATVTPAGGESQVTQNSEVSVNIESSQSSSPSGEVDVSNMSFGLADKIEDGVILHAWSWSFNTIRETMADIAAAGYSAVQTSPANACVEGGNGGMQLMGQGKWYYHYQPTDWTIGNYQLGTEEEFKAMCAEAKKYGVKVIVDVAPNHTTTASDAVSQNLIDAVGGIDKLYHKNGKTDISNYGDRTQCTTQAVGGLPDVNTENPAFQDYFIKYLNQCIADGASGFRYDTAKHIGLSDDPQDDSSLQNNFWSRVTTEITDADSIFNYGEVLQGDNERISDYISAIGAATASGYGTYIRSCIGTGLMNAEKLLNLGVGGSDNAITWVESHDNYTDGSSLKLTDEQIIRGWAIISGSGKGTPLFYDRPFGATADNQWGSMNRIGAAGSTLYKDSTVAAINHFHNAMIGEETKMSNPDKKVLMIERGSKGIVLINGKNSDSFELNADTALADGSYTDRAGSNTQFTVSGGKITGTLPANGIVVLYNDGYTDPISMPSVSIETSAFILTGDSAEITLHAQNSTKNTYTINGSSTEFSDGDKVTLNLLDSSSITVSASNSDGLTSNMTYYFTHLKTVKSGSEIYFEKPDGWGDKVYVYVYDETVKPVATNAEWPGKEMSKGSDGKYSYTLEQDWNSGLVIFSDGNGNQYPASLEPGDGLEEGKTYTSNITSVTTPEESKSEDNPQSEAVIKFKKPSGWGNVYAYVYENGGGGKNAEWPGEAMTDNGDGTYSYTVPSSVKSPAVIFTDGSNQYPAANEPGLEVENGKTYESSSSETPVTPSGDGAKVKFTKPDNWGDSVNAYVYENGGGSKNAEWPGEAMTDNGDGTYSYTVPSSVKNPVIIFNDGKKQYPKSAGLPVEDGKTYDINS